jgi:hypothetical protein
MKQGSDPFVIHNEILQYKMKYGEPILGGSLREKTEDILKFLEGLHKWDFL